MGKWISEYDKKRNYVPSKLILDLIWTTCKSSMMTFGILKQEQTKVDDIDPLYREAQLRLSKEKRRRKGDDKIPRISESRSLGAERGNLIWKVLLAG